MKTRATYLNRPMDFLLGTGYGQFTACMASWVILVLVGALAWVRCFLFCFKILTCNERARAKRSGLRVDLNP